MSLLTLIPTSLIFKVVICYVLPSHLSLKTDAKVQVVFEPETQTLAMFVQAQQKLLCVQNCIPISQTRRGVNCITNKWNAKLSKTSIGQTK